MLSFSLHEVLKVSHVTAQATGQSLATIHTAPRWEMLIHLIPQAIRQVGLCWTNTFLNRRGALVCCRLATWTLDTLRFIEAIGAHLAPEATRWCHMSSDEARTTRATLPCSGQRCHFVPDTEEIWGNMRKHCMFYGQFVSHAHVKGVDCLMFFGDSESNQAAKDKVCTQWSSLVQSNPASRRSSPQCLNNVSQDVFNTSAEALWSIYKDNISGQH